MNRLRTAGFYYGMTGQEGCEMRGHADGAHTGASSTVGNGKSFVQVQVTHVGADGGWTCQADLCIHIRAVHVNLGTVGVDDGADVLNALFENAVRRWIRDHQRG